MRYFNLALSALIISISGMSVSHARVDAVDVMKEVLDDFYGDMRAKYPRVTTPIDVEGNAEISTENAAEFIAKALIAKGDAPQADELFRRYYDLYADIQYPNPYRKAAILYEEKNIKNSFNFSVLAPRHIVEPETDEAEDGFTDINYEINEAWRVVLKKLVKSSPVTRPSIITTEVFHKPNSSVRSFKKHQNIPYCSKIREFKRRQGVWKSNWEQQGISKRRNIHLDRAKKNSWFARVVKKNRKAYPVLHSVF
jgi:hypothetical protein